MNDHQEPNTDPADDSVNHHGSLSTFPRLSKGGKTAVLYSPGYGAGWSTWNSDEWKALLTMHREIVERVLDNDREGAAKTAERLIREALGKPDEYVCLLGASDLRVSWVNDGSRFEIEEYDGSETIHVIGDRNYISA